MLKRILRKIKKQIGKKLIINPIFSCEKYINNLSSMSGGTLEGKNVLVITNRLQTLNIYRDFLLQENCRACYAFFDGANDKSSNIKINYYCFTTDSIQSNAGLIEKFASKLYGPIDIIINTLFIGDDENFFNRKGLENRFDGVKLFYQLVQIESEYFILHDKAGHLLNICMYEDNVQSNIIKDSIKSLTEGLGLDLGRLGIIVNGISAVETIPSNDVVKTGVYLISRYGEVLAGEVLEMKALMSETD